MNKKDKIVRLEVIKNLASMVDKGALTEKQFLEMVKDLHNMK